MWSVPPWDCGTIWSTVKFRIRKWNLQALQCPSIYLNANHSSSSANAKSVSSVASLNRI